MKMTIDEAIKHCEDEAIRQESIANSAEYLDISRESIEHCKQCAAEHRQLAKWLTELKEARRLLKAAVDDICALRKGANCNICAMPQTDAEREKRCDPTNGQDCRFIWRYAEVIEKIIGDEQHESTLPHVQET